VLVECFVDGAHRGENPWGGCRTELEVWLGEAHGVSESAFGRRGDELVAQTGQVRVAVVVEVLAREVVAVPGKARDPVGYSTERGP
jgi:hypothetical protein